jgi:WD40 repeat protein/tetratricopeptide (TPR) repeat protein
MRHLVVTVHGISTFGNWQERFEELLAEDDRGSHITVVNYKFGYFSVLAFLIPIFRWVTVRRFRRFLLEIAAPEAWERIDIVAHSFGTHIVAWALYGIAVRQRPRIDTLICAGSVLKSNFPWDVLIGHGVRRVINDCGITDNVLLLNQVAVLFTGMAGRLGFNGGISRTLRNRYFDFGHSGYFLAAQRPQDTFMRRYWVPLVTTNADPVPFDARQGGALTGIKLLLLNNAEPIKLIVYLSPFAMLAILFLNLYREADQQRQEATRQSAIAIENKTQADRTRDDALLSQSKFLASLSQQELGRDPSAAIELALEALPDPSSADEIARTRPYWPAARASLDAAVRANREILVLRGHEGVVTSVAVTPDASRIVSGSWDDTARIWDGITGKQLAVLTGHSGSILCVAISNDGTQIITGADDNTVRLWDGRTGKQLLGFHNINGSVLSVAISPDGTRIVAGSEDKIARVWDAETGNQLATLSHTDPVSAVAITADGSKILTGSSTTLKMWDARTFVQSTSFANDYKGKPEFHRGSITSIAASRDGARVVTGSEDGTARVWSARSGAQMAVLGPREGWVVGVAITPDGNHVVTGSGNRSKSGGRSITTSPQDNRLRIWDISTEVEIAVFKPHENNLMGISLASERARVITAAEDHTLRVWELQATSPKIVGNKDIIQSNMEIITQDSAAVTTDGMWIATTSVDNTTKLWHTRTGTQVIQLKGHEKAVTSLAVTPDGKRLVTGSEDGTARIWDAKTGAELLTLKVGGDWVTSVAITPDGDRIITGSGYWFGRNFSTDTAAREKKATIWDAHTGTRLIVLEGHSNGIRSVAVTPDGSRIITGSIDGTARIWDAQNGAEIGVIWASDDQVTSVAAMPDGHRVITGSFDGTARIWDIRTQAQLLKIDLGKTWVMSVVTFPDGKHIATGSTDGAARVWDAETGVELARLDGHEEGVMAMATISDSSLITISHRAVVRAWNLFVEDKLLIDHAKQLLSRCLTPDQRAHYFLSPQPRRWCGTMQKWPYDSDSALLEGRWSLASGQDEQARVYFAEVLANDPSSRKRVDDAWAAAYVQRGGELSEAGKDDEARDLFARAIALNPSFADWVGRKWADAHINRAKKFLRQRRDKEAETLFALAIARSPAAKRDVDDAWASSFVERANDMRREEKLSQAQTLLEEASRRYPSGATRSEMAKAYNELAWRIFIGGDPIRALPDAEKAVALSPDDPKILDTRGQIRLQLGRFKEGCDDLLRSASLGLEAAVTFYGVGRCRELEGQRDLAREAYRKALEQSVTDSFSESAQDNARERFKMLSDPGYRMK